MATFQDYYELTKPRLSFLSVFTALIGFWMAPKTLASASDLAYFVILATGIGLCAGGAAVLNQWMEYKSDGLMHRTKERPIPTLKIQPKKALIFGISLCIGGLFLLFSMGDSKLPMLLASLTIGSYLIVYTPFKKISALNTLIGAIPGALPPLIGWSAATGTISTLGWLLFAILFFWQMPHFYALSWMYKDDYAKAGFKMLSKDDLDGKVVAQHSFAHTLLLVIVTLLPTFLGFASAFYLCVAALLNLLFLMKAYQFLSSENKNQNAQRLFFASIIYLPLLLIVLLIDNAYLAI